MTWPKRRPSMSPWEDEKDWSIEERFGPEIESFSIGWFGRSVSIVVHSSGEGEKGEDCEK